MLDRMKKSISLAIALLIVMATIAVPLATAETSDEISVGTSGTGCGTCGAQNTNGSGCGAGMNTTLTELNGSEMNKAIAEALADPKVKMLRSTLIERGHTPWISNATAKKALIQIETESIETLMVGIPFRTDYVSAAIVYTNTDGNSTVIALENYQIDGKNYSTIYRFDNQGNVISSTIDINWSCWIQCIIADCTGCFSPYPSPPGACDVCCVACGPCIRLPNYITCGVCAACVVGWVGYSCWDQCP